MGAPLRQQTGLLLLCGLAVGSVLCVSGCHKQTSRPLKVKMSALSLRKPNPPSQRYTSMDPWGRYPHNPY